MFVLLYKRIGLTVKSLRGNRRLQIYAWGAGVSLFAHTAMMTAAGYYGQILLVWYGCFGLYASLQPARVRASAPRGPETATAPAPDRGEPDPREAVAGAGNPGRDALPASLSSLISKSR